MTQMFQLFHLSATGPQFCKRNQVSSFMESGNNNVLPCTVNMNSREPSIKSAAVQVTLLSGMSPGNCGPRNRTALVGEAPHRSQTLPLEHRQQARACLTHLRLLEGILCVSDLRCRDGGVIRVRF